MIAILLLLYPRNLLHPPTIILLRPRLHLWLWPKRCDTLQIYVQMNLAIVLFDMLKARCGLHALNIPVEVFQPPVQ